MKRIILLLLLFLTFTNGQAQRRRSKKVPEKQLVQVSDHLTSATIEEAIAAYDFDAAELLLNNEIDNLQKNKKSTIQREKQLAWVQKARLKLNAIEKITFIDSIIVHRNQVLDYIRLSHESGSLYRSADFFHKEDTKDCTVFKPQMGDKIIYAQANKKGVISLFSSDVFYDGTMSEPTLLKGISDNEDSQNYPFMMTDGTTIYFAAQGEESLGGYDIFMSRYDAEKRRYLAPENIGMPFNSPANDYLFAIDEVNNLGWFVTDRNMKGDKVCIYIFIPNETRQVYSPEDIEYKKLRSLARIHSVRETWSNQKEVDSARKRLREANSVNNLAFFTDFDFIVSNNVVYHKVSDFQNPMARQIAEKWLENRSELQKTRKELSEFRTMYHNASVEKQDEMAPAILQREAIEEELVECIRQQEKEMRIAEISK